MSTRSVVGTIEPDGSFRGRYVHWDGSPSTRGPVLAAALEMFDGDLDALLTELIDNVGGWSTISPKDGVLGKPYDDEYWYTGVLGKPADVEEWGFFFTSRDEQTAELVIVEGAQVPTEVGRVKITELPTTTEQDWYDIECGEHYERCVHMAWLHFPELGTDNRLNTRKWLGLDPLEPRDATGAVYKGRTYRVTGSGYSGGYYIDPTTGRSRGRQGLWYGSVEDVETGEKIDIPLYRTNSRSGEHKPISTTALIYPPIASTPKS